MCAYYHPRVSHRQNLRRIAKDLRNRLKPCPRYPPTATCVRTDPASHAPRKGVPPPNRPYVSITYIASQPESASPLNRRHATLKSATSRAVDIPMRHHRTARRLREKAENRLLARAAQNRAHVFAITYRAATVSERSPRSLFPQAARPRVPARSLIGFDRKNSPAP